MEEENIEGGGGEEIKCAIFENRRYWLPTGWHVIGADDVTIATRASAVRFSFVERTRLLFSFKVPSFSESGECRASAQVETEKKNGRRQTETNRKKDRIETKGRARKRG